MSREVEVHFLTDWTTFTTGLKILRQNGTKHTLVTEKRFDVDNLSVRDDKLTGTLGLVCESCYQHGDCSPEIRQGGFLGSKVTITGACVHKNDCKLANKFIPDSEFRK